MKKISLLGVTMVLLLAGVLLWWSGVFDDHKVRIRLHQKDIDALLAKNFPLEKKHLKVIRIRYRDPRAILIADSGQVRISITADIRAGIGPFEKEYTSQVTLLSAIDYDPQEHIFFLQQPRCEAWKLPEIPTEYQEISRQALNLTSVTCWERIPVYQWKPRKRSEQMARMVMQDVEIDRQTLVLTLRLPETLGTTP
jgi:hypothetical protein